MPAKERQLRAGVDRRSCQGTPFDSIEGAYEYVDLLASAIVDVRRDVDAEIEQVQGERHDRRGQAFQLVAYNLLKLERHIITSRRILNDLRTLRRLLLQERSGHVEEKATRHEISAASPRDPLRPYNSIGLHRAGDTPVGR